MGAHAAIEPVVVPPELGPVRKDQNIETAAIGDTVVSLLRSQICDANGGECHCNALLHFEEQPGHKDSIETGADSIEAPSILSSGPVAAGGPRTTRYVSDGREGPVYQGFGGRSGCSRTTKGNRECRVMAPRAGFEPATIRLTVGCSTAELPRN